MTRENHNNAHESPDIASSTDDYARRFSGPVGDFFLEVQTAAVLSMLPPNSNVLDVGGGHGQLAVPLLATGHRVTVMGSDVSCRERLDRLVGGDHYEFVEGPLSDLPFADQSFDVVLAFRMLPHLTQWSEFVGELCRVASRAVILDYPDLRSINWFSAKTFAIKKQIEKNTRQYRCFHRHEISSSLRSHQFEVEARVGQFVLPMALHRLMGWAAFSRLTERFARNTKLTNFFGSPVILKATRTV